MQLKRRIAVKNAIDKYAEFIGTRLDKNDCTPSHHSSKSYSTLKTANDEYMGGGWRDCSSIAEMDDIMALNMQAIDPTILYNIYNQVPCKINTLKKRNRNFKRYGQLIPLSCFTREYYFYNPPEECIDYNIDDACIDDRQEFRKDVTYVILGKSPRYFCQYLQHLKSLSLATLFNSYLYDYFNIRNLLSDLGNKWLGNSDIILQPANFGKKLRTFDTVIKIKKTDLTNKKCNDWFKNNLFDYLVEMCQIYNFEDHYYLLTKDLSDMIVDEIYLKVERKLERIGDEACDYIFENFEMRKRKYEMMASIDDDEIIRHQLEESFEDVASSNSTNPIKKSKLDFQTLDNLFQNELDAILSIQEYKDDYTQKTDEAVIEANILNNMSDEASPPQHQEVSISLELPDQLPIKKSPNKEKVQKVSTKKPPKKSGKSRKEKLKNITPVKKQSKKRKSVKDYDVYQTPVKILKNEETIHDDKKSSKLRSQIFIKPSSNAKKTPLKMEAKKLIERHELYLDSYLSLCKDLFNLDDAKSVLKLNFNSDFDILSKIEGRENPLMQYFIENDIGMLQTLKDILPIISEFNISNVNLQNVFLWSLSIYCMDFNNISKLTNEEITDKLPDSEKRRGLNPLLTAFRKKMDEYKKVNGTADKKDKSIYQMLLNNENISLAKPIVLNSSDNKLTEKSIKDEFLSFNTSLKTFLNDENLEEISGSIEEVIMKDITLVFHLQTLSKIVHGFFALAKKKKVPPATLR